MHEPLFCVGVVEDVVTIWGDSHYEGVFVPLRVAVDVVVVFVVGEGSGHVAFEEGPVEFFEGNAFCDIAH